MRRAGVIAAALLLSGCDPAGAAKDVVRRQMFDPGAAQFQDVHTAKTGLTCGLVNGKNRMGAYVGFTPFIAEPKAGAQVWPGDPREKYRFMSDYSRNEDWGAIEAACLIVNSWPLMCGTKPPPAVEEAKPFCDELLRKDVKIQRLDALAGKEPSP
jgi:hypothetical protein